MNKVGKLIREIRTRKGLTQHQLAKKVWVTDSCIRNYELGYRTPNEEMLILIADALGVSEHYFLEAQYPYSKKDLMRFLLKLNDTIEVILLPLEEGKGFAITFDERTNKELAPFFDEWEKVKYYERHWKEKRLNE
jgi:transcriptional regulator with XRE-family HTH domain